MDIVAQTVYPMQAFIIDRKTRRKVIREGRKIAQKVINSKIDFTYDNQTVTRYATFGLVESFKKLINFQQMLAGCVHIEKHHNASYTSIFLLELLIDAIILGVTRFLHMNDLQKDPGLKKLKNVFELPSERTIRDLLGRIREENITQLEEVMHQLLLRKASLEAPKEIWIDYDDSVITLFGNQEGGEVGYNARYKGRPSYKVKVAFIAESCELVKLKLYNGLTHGNGQFLEFHKAVEAILPRNYVLKGVRADKGFFDRKNLEYFEEKSLLYAIKAPMHDVLQRAAELVKWRELDETYSVGELTIPLTNWSKARRFIFIREKLPETKQKKLFPYEYQCIVTNLEDALPEDVWRFYNGRANIENKIDEVKAGFAIDEQSQERFLKNQAFALLKAIAYNLVNWVRTAFLPDEMKSYEVATIRRELLEVPGNVVGCGRYEHVRLARERIGLKPVIEYVKEQFRRYADLIVMDRYCEMRC